MRDRVLSWYARLRHLSTQMKSATGATTAMSMKTKSLTC